MYHIQDVWEKSRIHTYEPSTDDCVTQTQDAILSNPKLFYSGRPPNMPSTWPSTYQVWVEDPQYNQRRYLPKADI